MDNGGQAVGRALACWLACWFVWAGLGPCHAQNLLPLLAAPEGAVNTNLPGFKVRVVQGNLRFPLPNLNAAETLLRGAAIDPATGNPVADLAVPGTGKGGIHEFSGVINWHEARPQVTNAHGGLFTALSEPPAPDAAVPGIAGTILSRDYYAAEITGFLELPAGTIRIGVNSDDGFRLTFGTGLNPMERFSSTTVAVFDNARTFGSSEATLTVTEAGLYPFRLVWFENNGPNSGLEFYSYAPGETSGPRYLINDPAQPKSIRSFRDLVQPFQGPLAWLIEPAPGASGVAPSPAFRIEFIEQGIRFDLTKVGLSVDGIGLAAEVARTNDRVRISAKGPVFSTNSTHTATLLYADTAGVWTTNQWSFTIGRYLSIPGRYKVSDVDLSQLGFRIRNYQMPHERGPLTSGADGNSLPQVERALAGGYLDPSTGLAYTNRAVVPGAGIDGFLDWTGVINFGQPAGRPGDFGNFTGASLLQTPDERLPGIDSVRHDHYVAEIRTYLRLSAGTHRFGVNSDEGFILSVAQATGEIQGLVLASVNGGRRASDTIFDFVAEADGYYPFRLVWWEGTGDSSCEWFSVDLETGLKTLINDPTSPYQAYRSARTVRAHLTKLSPSPGSVLVSPLSDVMAEINHGTLEFEPRSVTLGLNGVGVAIGRLEENARSTVVKRAGGFDSMLRGGTNVATLVYSYFADGLVHEVTNTWSFVVGGTFGTREGGSGATPLGGPGALSIPYVVLPPGNKAPAGAVDLNRRGFKIVKVHQLDRSLDGVQTNGGRYAGIGGGANRMPRPEIQIRDGYLNRTNQLPFPNFANLEGSNPDRTFDANGVFDFSIQGVNAGVYDPSAPMPGLPGRGSSPPGSSPGLDHFVMETQTYLDLKRGSYLMSVNCDGGFVLTSAPNPSDSLGTLVGYFDEAGVATTTPSRWMSVVVTEDGLYPFRLLYWKGTGTGSVEWFAVDSASGQRFLVNDPAASLAIKAYREYIRPPRPWVRFSVYPMRAQWENVHQQAGPGPIRVAIGDGQPTDLGNGLPLGPRAFPDGIGAVMADLGSSTVKLLLNGEEVPPQISRVRTDTLIQYLPNPPLPPGSTNLASLVYAGVTNSWNFVVQNYATLPESLKLHERAPDPSARGFRVRVKKIRDGTSGVTNSIQRAEDHLRGALSFPDTAVPGPEPDASYLVPGTINWNQEVRGGSGVEMGFFTTFNGSPDEPIPGVGLETGGEPVNANDLISAEITGFLELPEGLVKMGINSDEGFRLTADTGFNAGALVIAGVLTNKFSSEVPFSFRVASAGLYPMRLVWYEASGAASLEWFSYGANNERVLVNTPDHPHALKSYFRTVESGPPTISVERVTGGWRLVFRGKLQQSTEIGGAPWVEVPGATSPFNLTTSFGQTYYRAVRP